LAGNILKNERKVIQREGITELIFSNERDKMGFLQKITNRYKKKQKLNHRVLW